MTVCTHCFFLIICLPCHHINIAILFFCQSEHSHNTCFRSTILYPSIVLFRSLSILHHSHIYFRSNTNISILLKKFSQFGIFCFCTPLYQSDLVSQLISFCYSLQTLYRKYQWQLQLFI